MKSNIQFNYKSRCSATYLPTSTALIVLILKSTLIPNTLVASNNRWYKVELS